MARFSEKDYKEMAPEVLRSIIREKTHHHLEAQVYMAMRAGTPPRADLGEEISRLLRIWDERGLSREGADLKWTEHLLILASEIKAGKKPRLNTKPIQPFPQTELATVEKLIAGRRSVRWWRDTSVSPDLIEKVVQAGLWAPHACNLQTLRVLIIESEKELALFRPSEVMGGPLRLVVCQDLRPYECTAGVPERNRLLDCGAAVQNMLLMAHALGLGAVWLTFTSAQEKLLRAHFELPSHIAIQTYLALGWPAESPVPPGRLTFGDVWLNKGAQAK